MNAFAKRISATACAAALFAFTAVAVAQNHDQHGWDNHANDHSQMQGHDDHNNQWNHDNHNDHNNQWNHDNHGSDYGHHFDDNARNRFQQHYQHDASRWAHNNRRPHFEAGRAIPRTYRIQPVPRTYWAGTPRAGYTYGYYDGYVVEYNPTTRIIADILDLATGH